MASFGAEGRVVAPGRFAAVTRACSQSASFGEKACAFAAEVVTPSGMAVRCIAVASGPVTSFGAEVSPTPTVAAAFRCADVASDLPASFGAEVSATPASARLPVRRPRRAEESSTGAASGSSARSPVCAGAPGLRAAPAAGLLALPAGRPYAVLMDFWTGFFIALLVIVPFYIAFACPDFHSLRRLGDLFRHWFR